MNNNVRKECNRIKNLTEEFTNRAIDTLIQQPAMPDSINKELTEFESLIFTSIMKKPTNKVIKLMKEYKAQYDEKHRAIYERLYSPKIAELDFTLDL